MTPEDPIFNPDQAAAIRRLRLRWLATLATVLPLPFIALPLTGSGWLEEQPSGLATQAIVIAFALGLGGVLVGLFTRNQAYKAAWRGEVVGPDGYLKGNTCFLSGIGFAAGAMFLVSVLIDYPAPTFAAAPVLAGLLALNFPNGKPMLPAPPRIGIDGDGP